MTTETQTTSTEQKLVEHTFRIDIQGAYLTVIAPEGIDTATLAEALTNSLWPDISEKPIRRELKRLNINDKVIQFNDDELMTSACVLVDLQESAPY